MNRRRHLDFLFWLQLLLITTAVLAINQQEIFSFDDQTATIPHDGQQSASETAPAPAPTATGLAAMVIKRITGWNDTVVAKLTGELTPRAPHPFVVSITDDNYHQVIHSDIDSIQAGWGSDDDTIWLLAVVANDRVSTFFDEIFDQLASNSSLAIHPPPPKKREDEVNLQQRDPNDPFLFKPHVRFARVDYMGKTDVTLTKWLIFKCPVLVVISKRGSELRFFKTGGVPPTPHHLSEFIKEDRWKQKPPWKSSFSPGGSREWVLTWFGKFFQGFHALTDKVPGWVLMMLSSMLGTSFMQWLHANQSPKKPSSSRATSVNPNQSTPRTLKDELEQADKLQSERPTTHVKSSAGSKFETSSTGGSLAQSPATLTARKTKAK